ncbi:hypothetical protein [Haloarcula litorea]|uniref:hypothetical protein n=1 Tax=Haloarcula litorea TaxID=3032579 RepID=UPI0023E8EC68|nr:hypothetical protein [Halomicroarcula sp. GDY20]
MSDGAVTDPDVGDHLRLDDDSGDDHAAGIYRVVGTPDDSVTLLRVSDADGRRAHTGDLVAVPATDLDRFAAADEPAATVSLAGAARNVYWSFRAFGTSLAANPLPSAVFGGLVLAGALGPRLFSTTGPLFDGLVLAGAFGLAYVGSGRL